MNNLKIFFALISAVWLTIGCSKKEPDTVVIEEPKPNPITDTSVETNLPNAAYSSAFQGQIRIRSVKNTTGIQATAITSTLTAPWGITVLLDG